MPCILASLDLQAILSTAPSIGLTELREAALLNRLDSKFIVREEWLAALVRDVLSAGEHRVLVVNGQHSTQYDNCFYDSENRMFFQDHTRGRKSRYKARLRRYQSNMKTFLEVKHKTVHGRTVKFRCERPEGEQWDAPLTDSEWEWFETACPGARLTAPVMWSNFNRFTLVSPDRSERFTVDTNLKFRSHAGVVAELPGCAIIEVKQERIDRRSPLFDALDAFRGQHPPLGRSTRVSKYVLGTALTQPQFPLRTYRPVMQQLERTFAP